MMASERSSSIGSYPANVAHVRDPLTDVGASPATLETETPPSYHLVGLLVACVKRTAARRFEGALHVCGSNGRIVRRSDMRRPGLTCRFCGQSCRNPHTRHLKVIRCVVYFELLIGYIKRHVSLPVSENVATPGLAVTSHSEQDWDELESSLTCASFGPADCFAILDKTKSIRFCRF
jgi:hypothetical protein